MCLAKNIYFEARGENDRGQYAVGLVTQKFVVHTFNSTSVCEVVKQGLTYASGDPIRNKCQFSWFCDGKSDNPRNKRAWENSIVIARNLLLYTIEDFTLGSTHYHTKDVSPKWSKEMTVATVIGSHIFYE